MNYSEKLRRFADYVESHGLDQYCDEHYDYPALRLYEYAENKERFGSIVKAIGTGEKYGSGGQIGFSRTLRNEEDNGYIFSVVVTLSGACEKVAKVDEEGNPVLTPVHKYVDTGEMEPEYEWHCPESFLALGDG